MIGYTNGHRYENYNKWGTIKYLPYNYKQDGLLNKVMSHKITESKNQILQHILIYIEKSMVFLMEYVDRLKNFKNVRWKNR